MAMEPTIPATLISPSTVPVFCAWQMQPVSVVPVSWSEMSSKRSSTDVSADPLSRSRSRLVMTPNWSLMSSRSCISVSEALVMVSRKASPSFSSSEKMSPTASPCSWIVLSMGRIVMVGWSASS